MIVPLVRPLAVALSLALAPPPSEAVAPALVSMAKQMLQDAVTSQIKGMLLGGLRDQGCKGMALANALESLPLAGGGLGGLAGAGSLSGMPAGMALSGLPAGMMLPSLPAGAGLPPAPAPAGTMAAGSAPAIPADMAAALGRMMPDAASLPPGMALDASQQAMIGEALKAMGQPLSPAETLATIDEMAALGFLPPSVQGELKECMAVLPQAVGAMGMGMAMLKPMIPKLREARDQMHALSPAEQDELAGTLAEELDMLSSEDRQMWVEQLGGGFFPPRVGEALKARLATTK